MLAEVGQAASLNLPKETRVPISASHIQSLITYALVGDETRNFPFSIFKITKWTHLSNVTVLAVDNVGVDDFESNPTIFKGTNGIFQNKMEIINPSFEKSSSTLALAFIPLTIGHIYAAAQACRTLDNAVKCGYIHNIKPLLTKLNEDNEDYRDDEPEITKAIIMKKLQCQSAKYNQGKRASHLLRSEERRNGKYDQAPLRGDEVGLCGDAIVTSEETSQQKNESEDEDTPCSRLDLLLSQSQIIREKIPAPGMSEYSSYKLTRSEYQPVNENSPMFSVDCEWVLCRGGIKTLARIAVVNERLECVYHTLVKPVLPVTDYLTKYSGVTGKMLNNVQTTLKDVQRDLQNLLPDDAILVGQAIGGDLIALELLHPYIIDTSVIYNLTGNRTKKTKLSMLAQIFLGRQIQTAADGHSPIEDALAAMELVLLKLRKGKDFGDMILNADRCQNLPTGDDLFRIKFDELNTMFQNMDHKMTKQEEAVYDPNCRLHQKLFTFIESHRVSAMLVTEPERVAFYRPTIIQLSQQPQLMTKKRSVAQRGPAPDAASPVEIIEGCGLKTIVDQTIASAGRHKLTLVHSKIDRDDETKEAKRLRKVDKCVKRLFEQNVAVNGLMIVFLSGTSDQNGVCLVRVNQQIVDLTGLTTLDKPQTLNQ